MALADAMRVAQDAGVLDNRSKRRSLLLMAISIAVLALAAASCGGGSSGDSSRVKKLLEQQLALAKAGDWQGLYNTYSPSYQSRCPYESVLQRATRADTAALQSLSYSQLHVRIDGDQAYVTYVTMQDGQVVASVTDASPDLYVKVDGTWFDEYDELAACSRPDQRPSPTAEPAPKT